MATAATGWKCTHTAEITAQTETTATIKVTCYWQNDGWTYDIKHVSAWVYCGGQSYKVKNDGDVDSTGGTSAKVACGSYSFTVSKTHAAQVLACYAKITSTSSYVSGTKSSTAANVSVTAKTSYTVTYAANGGSSTPAAQTKWHDENLTLAAAISRTGHDFKGWLSSAQSKLYAAGALYGYNAATTMAAQWQAHTYAVTYNANGGTDAPAAQVKTYGTALTLSSTVPTRANYNFKGWATSASATAAAYQAGGSYTSNEAATLYAVWELAYQKPRISNFAVARCDANGNANDGGAYVLVSFKWQTDKAVSSIAVAWTAADDNGSETIAATGTSGTVSQVIGGDLSTDATYTVTVIVADSDGSTPASATLAGMAFSVDFREGGNGAAFNKPAEKEGFLEINLDIDDKFGTQIRNGLAAYAGSGDAAVDPDTTLEQLVLTNKNTPTAAFYFVTTMFYSTKSETANRAQIAVPYNANARSMYHRYYTGGAWSSWQRYNNFIVDAAGTDDPDTTVEPMILTNTNTPMGGYYMYIQTVFQGAPSATGARSQIAYPYNRIGSVYHRYYSSGAWSEWRRQVNADESPEFIKASSLGANGAGYIHYSSGLCIQWGNVAIALTAKTVGSTTVTFQTAFSATPSIVVTAQSTVPGTYYMETAMASPSNTSFKIYAYRTNADSGTYHRWVAIGYKE